MTLPVHLDFGDGVGAQARYAQWVPHTYLWDGLFLVVGHDVAGRTGHTSVTVVNVAPPPGHVTLTVTPDPTTPLVAVLTATSSNGGTISISWGDSTVGTVESGGTISHAYAAPGDYTITTTDTTLGTASTVFSIPVSTLVQVDWHQDVTLLELWQGTETAFYTQIDVLSGSAPGSIVKLVLTIAGADQFTFQYEASNVAFWTPVTPLSATSDMVVVEGSDTLDLEVGPQLWANFDVAPNMAPPGEGSLVMWLLDASGAVISSLTARVLVHAQIINPTGANQGVPGVFTPPGADVPANGQDLAINTNIIANPSTMWDAGTWIMVGDGTEWYWSGTAWVQGHSPGPPIPATTAVAGTPGGYQPTGATQPATGADIQALTAQPTTPWANGQWVQAVNGDQRWWNGTSWQPGAAPTPPPPAVGANVGSPGSFTPTGAATPATGADIALLAASPSTRWPQGTWVQAANGDQRWWDGSAWQTGQAPTPPLPASGATAGTPGTWTPPGSAPPNYTSLSSAVVASPSTFWPAGSYVVTADGIEVYWNGQAWVSGRAPTLTGPVSITSVNPSPLPVSYQGPLTVRGTGFFGATDVQIDGTSVPFTVNSDTLMTAQVVTGGGSVLTVTTPLGSATYPLAAGTWDLSNWGQTLWG